MTIHALRMPGLPALVPIGWMACLGLLRLCTLEPDLRQALGRTALSWAANPGWQPILHSEQPCNAEELVSALAAALAPRLQRVAEGKAPEFAWAPTPRIKRETFGKHSADAAQRAKQEGDRRWSDYMAALGTEIPAPSASGKQGDEKATASSLYMLAGQVRFITEGRRVAEYLLKDPKQENGDKGKRKRKKGDGDSRLATVLTVEVGNHLKEALRSVLFQPWEKYTDQIESFGWDPIPKRPSAYRLEKAAKDGKYGIPAASWLALESLPLFPCAVEGGRLHTAGFLVKKEGFESKEYLTIFLWQRPLALEAVRFLVQSTELVAPELSPALKNRGVVAVYRSCRVPNPDSPKYRQFSAPSPAYWATGKRTRF